MDDAQLFTTVARQAGYGAAAAEAALAWARSLLAASGPLSARLYIFRTGQPGAGAGPADQPPAERPRVLLAFRSADAALSFAQAGGLGAAPRVAPMGLGQLLSALVQRPAIGTLLVAGEDEARLAQGLPAGTRIERAELLDRLQLAEGPRRGSLP